MGYRTSGAKADTFYNRRIDPKVLQYALVVSYANGAGALLRTFSSDRKKAISKINDLDADEFLEHVARNHPAPQAPRYIYKLEQALDAM